ncbi:MAG: hypothetical protein HQM10_11265 [Candidatus Riflebacteria bacterium]|nr:hypothetical protein [Candidatus Riflebacteria bacterium]
MHWRKIRITLGIATICLILAHQWAVKPCDQLGLGPGIDGPCVIASFHKILKFWKTEVPVSVLTTEANDRGNLLKRWTSAKHQLGRLSLLAKNYGLSCIYCLGDQKDLEKLIKLSIPVLIHSYRDDVSHASVLIGIKEFPQYFTLADSYTEDYEVLSKTQFAKFWQFQNCEYVIIAPEERIPAWCAENAGFAAKVEAGLLYSQWKDNVYPESHEKLLSELEILKNASKGFSRDLYYWIITAYIREIENQTSEALTALENIVIIKPDYEKFLFYFGVELKKNGNFKKAVEAFNKFLQFHPSDEKTLKAIPMAL